MRVKFIIYLLLPLVLIICLFTLSNYWFLYPSIEEKIINEKKNLLKELTHVTLNTIENCNTLNKDIKSQDEIKKIVLEQIRNLNYGRDQKSYFWVIDFEPKMLMHPYRSDLEGKSLVNYKDINGIAFFNIAIEKAKRDGEGFLEYNWQWQDDSTKILPKLSFVKLYKNWNWIVGTGMYIDDIEIEISKIRRNELKSIIFISILIIILVISIIYYGIKTEKQREKALFRLKLSEEKFRNIFNDSNDIVLMIDMEGVILDINKKSLLYYDLKYEDIVGKKAFEMIPEKYHANISERLKLIGKKELEPLEIEILLKKDLEILVEIKSSLSSFEDKPVILSILRDISLRKMHEKELIESRLHYKIVADYTSAWEYWIDPKGEFIYISPSCKRISGYEPKEFEANPNLYSDIIVEEDKEIWNEHHTNAMEHHIGNDVIQYRIITKGGEVIWIEHSCQPVYDNENNYIGARGSNRDITYRKKAEEKLITMNKHLEISESKFKTLSDVTFEGIAIHEFGFIIDNNLAFSNMFGYTRDELLGKNVLEKLFDKESVNKINTNIKKDFNKPYEVTGIRKDGSIFPVEIEGKNYHTERFNPSLRVTALRDITARKQAEKEIRKLSKAVEQSANLLVITDPEGIIEFANEKFYQTTGFTKEEVIGKTPRILKSGEQDKQFYIQLWKTILSGNVWRGELCNKKKNGELYWESTLITPVLDENNKTINFMSVKEDITEKKLAEVKLFNAIIETEEKERKKFAEDLHDELGPHLSGIRLYINELEDENINFKRRNDIVRMLDVMVKEAIDKTRTISNQLMPSVLTDYGLIKALKSFCLRINNTNVININLNCNDGDFSFNKTTEIVIYRVIIELVNNTIKHAKAKNIYIEFAKMNDKIELVYKDDGKGFDFKTEIKNNKGLGLSNLINRMKSIEGSYKFESYPQKGIIFRFTFSPIKI